MSGSSGGYMPHIESNSEVDCSKLSFSTSLTSPVAVVVATLNTGDILDVELTKPSSLQVFDLNGVLVGSLLTYHQDNIINCIQNGFEFSASVIKINGGNCEVLVRAK